MANIATAYKEAIAQITGAGAAYEIHTKQKEGVSYQVYRNAPQSLREIYAEAANHGDKDFLVYEGERWSFRNVLHSAGRIATALTGELGIEKGDRVGIAMRNYPEWMVAFIAITAIGAVAVPMNSWGKARELAFALDDAGCKLLFCDQQRFDLLEGKLENANLNAVIVRPAADAEPGRAFLFNELLESATDSSFPLVKVDSDDVALIMYTSGTTGTPKGAVSTHGAICQALLNIECCGTASALVNPEAIGAMLEKGHDLTLLLAVPLFHVSGLHAVFLASLKAGRKLVVMYKWDVERALQLIEAEHITTFSAAPAMLQQLLESPHFDKYNTNSLSSLGAGGSAVTNKVINLIQEKVAKGYPGAGWGLTETNSSGAAFTGAAFLEKPNSAGFIHPTVEISIRDVSGEEVPRGMPGAIWIKTPTLISQYWNRPDANKESFSNGWFDSGDIGYLDEDGFLFLSDRAKDLIIRGGENIYPAEIESVLLECPGVHEVAVFGVPDEQLGELVCAVIQHKKSDALNKQTVQEFARKELAAFKVPRYIELTTEPLPRNPAGKVLKHKLRESVTLD